MNRSRVPLVLVLVVLIAATSAFAAKPVLTCYFPVNLTDAAWQKAALGKVQKAWTASRTKPAAGKKTVVQSSIGRDGTLIGAVVTMKSDVKEWDDAALAAVKKAGPFPPLPKSVKDSQVEVHWHFAVGP